MYSGYLAFAGVEIVNTGRAATYAQALGVTTVQCNSCPALPRVLGETSYTSPDQDDAPWWDPIEPASKDLAGFVGLEVTGLSKSVAARAVVPLADNGAALHPLRRPHKEIQVKTLMIARTESALSYGYSWLAGALRGQVCGGGCLGDALCFLTACPTCDPPLPDVSDPCGDVEWRTMRNVGLLTMDDPSEIRRITGGWLAQITYTFTAGDPFIYRDPLLVATGPRPSQQLPNYMDPGVPADCTEAVDCLQDPTCPEPPAPSLPPVPVDSCYPTGPFTASRYVVTLERDTVPIWQEKVPLVIVKAGQTKLERLTLRWYNNPTDSDCGAIDPCAACAEMNIAFVPAGATLTIDGRIESAFVDCPGGPGISTAEPQLYSRGGGPFVWPVFSCSGSMCLEVIAQADSVASDSSIEVYYVVREDAA